MKDDATAAKLVTQFGLACITLDGKISRPGSMQVSMSKKGGIQNRGEHGMMDALLEEKSKDFPPEAFCVISALRTPNKRQSTPNSDQSIYHTL